MDLTQPAALSADLDVGIPLPSADVRTALDDAVGRLWAEHTRRAVRVAVLLGGDTLAGLLGIWLVLQTWFVASSDGLRPLPDATPLLAMVLCIQPLALRVTGAYAGGGRARTDLGRIAAGLVMAAAAGWVQARLFGHDSPALPNKAAYGYSAALLTATVWTWRLAFDQLLKTGFRAGVLQRRVVVVGHRGDLERVQRQVDHSSGADIRVVAALSPSILATDPERLDEAVKRSAAHGVIIAADMPFAVVERIIARCFHSGVSVSLFPQRLQDLGSAYFELRDSSAGVVLQVLPLRFGLPQLAAKRTMDMALTAAALVVTWPLFLLIAIAIKLDSKGPVFFAQERVGVGGRSFRMLKFRTMRAGADAMKGQLAHLNRSGDPRLFKIPNDPRITRVGSLLRRTSLDELPQVLNVLKGEMSLVGPRPFFPGDLNAYETHHFERLHVLPGITGLWQVSGRSDVVDFEEVVRLDRQYIREWSLMSDLWILVRTIPAALGRGAY